MSDEDCTPGREPRSVAASWIQWQHEANRKLCQLQVGLLAISVYKLLLLLLKNNVQLHIKLQAMLCDKLTSILITSTM